MDFTPRNDSPAPNSNHLPHSPASVSPAKKRSERSLGNSLLRYSTLILLFSTAILMLAVAAAFARGNREKEANFVKGKQLQAVFLNGGQVYFGNITSMNSSYISMANIYYLRVNQSVQPNASTTSSSNDVSLVKLGCELHGPEDQMVINQTQVIFWENLKTDGQVAKAVAQFQKDNPKGQDCATQNAATPNTAAPTTTTPTTTKPKQ